MNNRKISATKIIMEILLNFIAIKKVIKNTIAIEAKPIKSEVKFCVYKSKL